MPYTLAELELLRQLLGVWQPGNPLLVKLDAHIKRQRSAEAYNAKPRRNDRAF